MSTGVALVIALAKQTSTVTWMELLARCAPLPSSNLVPFGRGWHARGREHCRGEPGSALSGGYAPDSTKAEGSSIVDEPGEG